MPTADAHVHLFEGGYEGTLGRPPAGVDEVGAYEGARARFGIERALVVAYEGSNRYVGNSEYVLCLAQRHQWIAPTWCLPVVPAPSVEMLRSIGVRGVTGYSVYLDTADDGLEFGRWPQSVFAELSAQRTIVSLNATPAATAVIGDALDALEACAILFSHLGSPPSFGEVPSLSDAQRHLAPLLRLARRSHVGVKLSGVYAVSDPNYDFPHEAAAPFVQLLLDAFGSERLYWGSDFSPALDFVSFAQVADVRLLRDCSTTEVAAIMGGNLLELLAKRKGGAAGVIAGTM